MDTPREYIDKHKPTHCQHGKTDFVYCADCHVIHLQEEIENLTRERDGYKGGRNNEYILRLEITKQNSALEGENAILRAALMWYADKEKYLLRNPEKYESGDFARYEVMDDYGERARSIIAKLEPDREGK